MQELHSTGGVRMKLRPRCLRFVFVEESSRLISEIRTCNPGPLINSSKCQFSKPDLWPPLVVGCGLALRRVTLRRGFVVGKGGPQRWRGPHLLRPGKTRSARLQTPAPRSPARRLLLDSLRTRISSTSVGSGPGRTAAPAATRVCEGVAAQIYSGSCAVHPTP